MNGDRFPAVMAAAAHGRVLLDNAAGTQLPDTALERIQRYLAYDNAQIGGIFPRSEQTAALVDRAKNEFAELIGVPAALVGIGANATSLALALSRLLASSIQKGDRVVVTAADHEANVAPWIWLRRFGAQIDVVPVDHQGDLDETRFAAYLQRAPVLVALPWASNVTGTVFDVARYAQAAQRAGATVVVDGVQAFPHLALELDPAIDFAFFSAYKIYAPHAGFWYASRRLFERYVRTDNALVADGDARYWTLETGTQSYEAMAGWLGTLDYFRSMAPSTRLALETIAAYERELCAYTRAKFAERAGEVRLYGRPAEAERLPVFAFGIGSLSSDELARRFERANIEARVGDFYSRRLLQTLSPESGGRAVRLSFAHYNTSDDVDRCFDVIDAALSHAGVEALKA